MTRAIRHLGCISVVSMAITLFAASIGSAQTQAPSASATPAPIVVLSSTAFAAQVQGRKVWLTMSDGLRRKGRVKTMSSAGMTLTGVTPAPVPFDRIERLENVTHRVRNGAIGGFLLVFLPATIIVSVGYCEDVGCSGSGEVLARASLYGGLGALAGAAIGAAVNAHNRTRDVLYNAPHRTTSISLAPILSPARKGIAFSMTWR
jgi:hypothetical protein